MIAMGTDYWTQQKKMSERAWEEMSSSALRVQAFRSTLESYFIPKEGVGKYTAEFLSRRTEILYRSASDRLAERLRASDASTAAEVMAGLADLEYVKPEERELRDMSPAERKYLNSVFLAQLELLEAARKEYLDVDRPKQEAPYSLFIQLSRSLENRLLLAGVPQDIADTYIDGFRKQRLTLIEKYGKEAADVIESRKEEEITVNDLRQTERGYLKELMEAEHKLSSHGIIKFGKSSDAKPEGNNGSE